MEICGTLWQTMGKSMFNIIIYYLTVITAYLINDIKTSLLVLINNTYIIIFLAFSCFSRVTSDVAKFVGACTVDALSYLQSLEIVHRNVVPENMFVDHLGYVLIVRHLKLY